MNNVKTKNIDDSLKLLYKNMLGIIDLFQKKFPNDVDIEQLRRLIIMLNKEEPLVVMKSIKDAVWKIKDHIINENEEYFLSNDRKKEIKNGVQDKYSDLANNLTRKIFSKIRYFSEKEKETIWKKLKAI